ncbi:D-serine ammonia-lyase [uncultured Cloacibacillus sp.]|uniref:D-serine ammonia-lyase n=1 Tax=uncultured Cloacibacillus sp. TaxID=889794 RepID=UPI00320ADB9F
MDKEQVRKLMEENPTVRALAEEREILWLNSKLASFETARGGLPLSMADVDDAEARLARFAPFIMKKFPETAEAGGIIESELREAAAMKERLNEKYGAKIEGRLFVKMDGDLPIAGSIKARGGIYEVLKHTEELALEHGLLREGDSYEKLASDEARKFFSQYTMQVGSTGNLGLSIGIMSAAVGYNAVVHMSADARAWKKALLRSHGVKVIEYDTDYSEAVKQGRAQSDADPKSYFVDDENSKNLFLGYAVAAKRLVPQLKALGVAPDAEHPLFVYLPCGVGGAPGGVAFGLKQMFGDAVHCFFIEPTQAPCMVLGMASGLHNGIAVKDVGLTGLTHADGLAVGRASGFVGRVMEPLLSGGFTLRDAKLYEYMRDLLETENAFIEPGSCAAFEGPALLGRSEEWREYIEAHGLAEKMKNAAHIAWATGGRLVPEEIRKEYIATRLA